MVTLKDISRDLGLSVTQVSRALGGHADVNAQTRKRVRAAADRLGYRPNAVARGLKTGRSGIVAMVVSGTRTPEASAHLLEIVMGLSAEFSRIGLRFVLHVAQPDEDTVRLHEDLFLAGGIDGFIVISPQKSDPRIAALTRMGAAFVVHGRDPDQAHVHVDIDNFEVGRRMTDHLLRLGHRRIAFLTAGDNTFFSRERVRGLKRAYADHGLDAGMARVVGLPMIAPEGQRAASTLLSSKQRPTAIIAGNTLLARGVYRAAAMHGLQIPCDLSVLAHDDDLELFATDTFDPPIGGTFAPLSQAWVSVADTLQTMIEPEKEGLKHRILPLGFQIGGSAKSNSD
ncbi:LacI family DNA-binding transcriptional regulator [Loktanella sp. SALINAS62]|uniref:LacI family DNA-binding transcriptional regulator n=1 Tax=Loktanella sp. SALINAS62 TaxID=2706124 RepID=UPI001B8A92C7|nr:LacI family DNA-binding transcriptional regulator [Loktanella sp. SALINAS62]MBS1300889.1 LacI family transcriptional regulator [Loktanella sp. SALINAS62]